MKPMIKRSKTHIVKMTTSILINVTLIPWTTSIPHSSATDSHCTDANAVATQRIGSHGEGGGLWRETMAGANGCQTGVCSGVGCLRNQ